MNPMGETILRGPADIKQDENAFRRFAMRDANPPARRATG